MNFGTEFPNRVLINLERRPDRLALATQRLTKAGVSFEVFKAVDGDKLEDSMGYDRPATRAVAESFIGVLKMAKERGWDSVVIFEDDVDLVENIEAALVSVELPPNWDFLYLGCACAEPGTMVAERILQPKVCWDTHAVVVRSTAYDLVMTYFSPEIPGPQTDSRLNYIPINRYSIFPNLAWQADDISDIQYGQFSKYFPDGTQRHPIQPHQPMNQEPQPAIQKPRLPLVPLEEYDHVFSQFKGLRVYFEHTKGNPGDDLINEATKQLFEAYQIQLSSIVDSEAVLFGGGGNMGMIYRNAFYQRIRLQRIAASRKIPFVILPQSWMTQDLGTFDQAFARESFSLRYQPKAVLSHDLALSYVPTLDFPEPTEGIGRMFRDDRERNVRSSGGSDPAALAKTAAEYLNLAASFEEIHTDRLHFAIAGLIVGREVTLYPNSYFKNRAVWEHSLSALGCRWGSIDNLAKR